MVSILCLDNTALPNFMIKDKIIERGHHLYAIDIINYASSILAARIIRIFGNKTIEFSPGLYSQLNTVNKFFSCGVFTDRLALLLGGDKNMPHFYRIGPRFHVNNFCKYKIVFINIWSVNTADRC